MSQDTPTFGADLQRKLDSIRAGQYTPQQFIVADAKDGDMGFGATAPGPHAEGGFKTREDYLDAMTTMVNSELADIMLMSVSSAEVLHQRGVFAGSPVTPAVRLNDTTDIWSARYSLYRSAPSEPFATASVAAARRVAPLGLYSMTFNNNLDVDLATLNAYNAFRMVAEEADMQHFLEVFNPAFDIGVRPDDLGFYINDMIVKALAGVHATAAPLFLKIQFNGMAAMRELSQYDPSRLIVGILGGSQGTTRDTFELIAQAEASGARVALFGRKINLAESPTDIVHLMRAVIKKEYTAEEAVNQYHDLLAEKNIKPQRALQEDRVITDPVLQTA